MKVNLPVTGTENNYPEGTVIVSNTDLKGAITHINQDFMDVAGFSEDELMGINHNVVRHPDMPPLAFADLWESMKNDTPWIGIVKNRCKNGDHYWVEAYSAPIIEEGQTVGYQSVRVKPKRELVERAEAIYQAVNAGKVSGRTLATVGHANKILFGSLLAVGAAVAVTALLPAGFVAPLAGLFVGLTTAFIASRVVSKPLRDLAKETEQQIINNPISRLVFSGRTDEIGQLHVAWAMQNAKLRTLLGRTTDASGNLTDVAVETAAAAEQTRSALSRQRSETEQVVTAITELSATVQEVAKNTAEAASAANAANDEASNIKVVVSNTIGSISNLEDEINKASKVIQELDDESNKIGRVLGVIREIADQTNLLALNAAIEAARAGDAGRGFAVVADEVRTLASRTAESTQEIDSMISMLQSGTQNAVNAMGRAQEKAAESVEQVGETAESLSTIASSIMVINDMNNQIATASEEQSAVTDEVDRSMHSISSSADETSTGAERTVRASEAVAHMAQDLRKVVLQCDV